MKKFFHFILAVIVIVTLTACLNIEEPDDSGFTREDVQITQTVNVGGVQDEASGRWSDATEQTVTETFKTNPRYVALFNFDILDMLNVAGIDQTSIVKLGFPKSNIPGYLSDFEAEEYVNVGTLFAPDWTALDQFIPDLIVIGGRSSGAYSELKRLYPYADVLDVSMTYGDYIEGIEHNAEQLGKIFPSISETLETEIASLKVGMERVKAVAQNFNALFVMLNGTQISFFPTSGSNARFAVVHDEFGFIAADPYEDSGSSAHGNVAGYEYIRSVNAQILVVLDRGAATGSQSGAYQDFLDNGLVQQTIAGENGDIYPLDPMSWYISTGGIESTQIMIQNFEAFVLKYSNQDA